MQQPKPTNNTGVPVTLSVIDSNGNLRQIGTTTSDAAGTYSFTWTPDISGTYAVIANFAGSNSYYGSSAQTHFYASERSSNTCTNHFESIKHCNNNRHHDLHGRGSNRNYRCNSHRRIAHTQKTPIKNNNSKKSTLFFF